MEPIDVALRFGVLALENGGTGALADRAFASVLKSAGVNDGFAVWRLDSASGGRTCDGHALVHAVGPVGVNLRRVWEIAALTDRASRGAVPFDAFDAEIDHIAALGPSYGPWTTVAATALLAGLFARTQNGDWAGFLIAAGAAAAGQAVRVWLLARQMAIPAATFAAALLSAVTAAFGLQFRLVSDAPGTLMAAVIYLIPGLPLINGFFDMVTPRFLVLGAQRLASAVLIVTLTAIAVALAVAVMR
ncbi:MAG TPA: threonine/serine exporter family protein [Vicinamibacterales bacterium]|nr:threonine/serine exporter family protein [Vicinamibacterales bacterium]